MSRKWTSRQLRQLDTMIRYADPRQRALDLLRNARRRAKKSGVEYSLSTEDIVIRVMTGRCEATGLRFSFDSVEDGALSPSLHRVDNSRGYTPGNVMVVCMMHNAAQREWGSKQLERYCRALVAALDGSESRHKASGRCVARGNRVNPSGRTALW